MTIYALPDLTLTGSAQQVFPIADLGGSAQMKWFQLQLVTASGAARIGNVDVTATRGIPIAGSAYAGQFAPPIAEPTSFYDGRAVYVIGTVGDTLSRVYAV